MKESVINIIIICVVVFIAFQLGWIENIKNYFMKSIEMSHKEQVIKEPDGSITKIRYKNVFDLIFDNSSNTNKTEYNK